MAGIRRQLIADLSPAGFDKLEKDLQELKKDIVKANDKFLNISLDYLQERAILRLGETTGQGSYPLTGDLVNAFAQYREPNKAILRNEAFHAAFVEFGTGVVGQVDPHEWAAEMGITYDENQHGWDGWVYMGDDGEFYHTLGLEPRRFMYTALMDYLYGGGKEDCMRRALNE